MKQLKHLIGWAAAWTLFALTVPVALARLVWGFSEIMADAIDDKLEEWTS